MSSSPESKVKCEKFGRVFLRSCDKKDAQSQLKPISTACFSNWDWRWYDVCGDIHPKYKDSKERNFSVGFSLNNLVLEDGRNSFEVRLRLPLHLGSVGIPNMEHFKQVQTMERSLATQLNFISKEENDPGGKFLEEASTAALLLLMTPGKELIGENNNFLLHLIPFIFFNELVENNKSSAVSELRNKVPYKVMSVIPNAASSILKGEANASSISSPTKLLSIVSSGAIPIRAMFELEKIFRSYRKLNQGIYEEVLKFGEPAEAQPFLQVLTEYTESLFLQMSQEWNASKEPSFRSVTMKAGRAVGPTTLASEAIALQCGVRLREEIRSSILFKQLLQEIATHTSKVYDLVSYNKVVEMASSHPERVDIGNEVHYLHKVGNWPLEKALEKVMDDANESMARLGEIGKLLLQLYDNDQGLTEYLQIVHGVICGYIQWLGFTSYYHPNLIFDCYVEESNDI